MSLLKGAAAILLLVVAGYSLTGRAPPETSTATAHAPIANVPTAPGKTDQTVAHWPTPIDAPAADKAIMHDWYAANETCRGDHVAADSKPCKTRDGVEARLRSRGWCWEYEDPNVFPPDFKWHRCSEKSIYADYKGSSDQSSGEADGSDVAEMDPTPVGGGAASDEKKFPGLERYKLLIAPAIRAEALYEANQQCTGQPGWEGRNELQRQMTYINARYFPREPGMWIAAGAWAQRVLDATVIAENKRVCVTLDPG